MAGNKDKARQADKRAARRDRARAAASVAASGPTFGEAIEHAGLVARTSHVTRNVIARAEEFIAGSARTQLSVISCHGCTAPKGCCHHRVTAWLHEGVPIAQRLRHEQRDTPALRDALRDAAVLMARRDSAYSRPCVFLDAAERCTIYDDRPSVCGTTLVSTDPARCSGGDSATVSKYVHPYADAPAMAAQVFAQQLGLPPDARRYGGTLPGVVLTCLEAWDRRDYVEHIASRHPAVGG